MWTATRQAIGNGEKVAIAANGRSLSFAEVIALWRDDAAFRGFFTATLAATPFAAFFWEMPPIRRGHGDMDYEYVAIRSGALAAMRADPSAFRRQFKADASLVASFPNLGGDALLVAPRPLTGVDCYGHIGAFVRSAPDEQRDALLEVLGAAIERRLASTDRKIWVSTSGLGVPWLHVRLDSRPKYYQHGPYAGA